ncbi:MAG: HepT-like ribonuclease domain-containing protein [Pseudohongiellaceae bacterium]
MSKPWEPYALHILDAIEKIQRIQARGDLTEDDVLYDAALRNLQTLSEATQLLPDDKKAAFPAIPWREISGFRNILVHNYLGNIDPLTVATVINKHLQPLEACIRAMLADAGRTG